MNNLNTDYERILEVLRKMSKEQLLTYQRRRPKLSDLELSIDLSPASVHDINYLKDIQMQIRDCTLIGDRGYLSVAVRLNLFETCNITLNTSMRVNQKEYKKTTLRL